MGPNLGAPRQVRLPNRPTAFANAGFVSKAVAERVAAGTMQPCGPADVVCILPLQVAFNSAGKPRLVWDGTHVNEHLPEEPFRMETLQREGRSLFERAGWGGTVDISSAYHHIHMHPASLPYLGFEWEGQLYRYAVLPFGLSTAPRIFTTVNPDRPCIWRLSVPTVPLTARPFRASGVTPPPPYHGGR